MQNNIKMLSTDRTISFVLLYTTSASFLNKIKKTVLVYLYFHIYDIHVYIHAGNISTCNIAILTSFLKKHNKDSNIPGEIKLCSTL